MTTKCTRACVVHCGRDGDYDGDASDYGNNGEKTELSKKKDKSRQNSRGGCFDFIPARYVLALMSFTGFISIFTLRMDLNIAILSIADPENNTSVAKTNMSVIMPNDGWSEAKQGLALSAFFYGYCCTQVIGGYLSGIVGAARIMGYSVMVTSLVALVTPRAIMEGFYLLIICRVVQGMAQGLAQPCMHTLWSNWAPKEEKAKLMTFSFSGCQLGMLVATLATGYMCEATPVLKWSLVFYVFGGFGFLWSVAWILLIYETPQQHPRISKEELEYIEQTTANIQDKQLKARPPWCKMVLNPAFLAILAAQFANDWGYFAVSTCLPLYMQHVLKYDIKQNGFLSSLPFIVLLFVNPLCGLLSDWLIARGVFSTKNCRKVMNSIGLLTPSVLMVGVCFVGLNRQLTITLLTLALGFTGFTMAGYTVNHLDIAPPFAGLLYSISNSIGTTTGFIGPAIVSALTTHHNTYPHWRIFFFLTAAIFFIGGIVFLILAEGEPLPWVRPYLREVMAPGSKELRVSDSSNSHKENDTDEEKDNFDDVGDVKRKDDRKVLLGTENDKRGYKAYGSISHNQNGVRGGGGGGGEVLVPPANENYDNISDTLSYHGNNESDNKSIRRQCNSGGKIKERGCDGEQGSINSDG